MISYSFFFNKFIFLFLLLFFCMVFFIRGKSSRLSLFVLLVLFVLIVFSFSVISLPDPFLDGRGVGGDFFGVVLGSSDGAYGFGHVALLLESEDGWFYFSWQSMKVVFVEVPSRALSSFESFNSWIDEEDSLQNYIHDFDSAFFFRGNFSGSVTRAEELFQEFVLGEELDSSVLNVSLLENNPGYNVVFNNCISVAFDVLGEAGVNGVFVKDFVSEPSFIAVLGVKQLEASLSEGSFFS